MNRDDALRGLAALAEVVKDPDGSVPETYLIDGRQTHGAALAVVAPRNLDEVFAILDYAAEHKLRVVPQGARTGVVGATVPLVDEAENHIILTMERYKEPIEYNEADRVVVVSAGVTLEEVNEHLTQFGVRIPVDFSVPHAQIGGMTATNVGGESVVRYGNFRHNIAGVEVALANRELVPRTYNTINRPVKDASDIDFTGAFVGSNGTLGVIVRSAILVVPIVERTHAAWIQLPRETDLTGVLIDAKRIFGKSIMALEFVSHEALKAVKDSPEQAQSGVSMPFQGDTSKDAFFIIWEGKESDLAEDPTAEQLEAFLERFGEDVVVDVPLVKDVRNIRERVSDAVATSGSRLVACDISSLTKNFHEMRHLVRAAIAEQYPDVTIADFGHMGDGGLHMNVVVPMSYAGCWGKEEDDTLRIIVSDIVRTLGGSPSAEHGRGAKNRIALEKSANMTTEAMHAGLKSVVDPDNIMGHSAAQPFTQR